MSFIVTSTIMSSILISSSSSNPLSTSTLNSISDSGSASFFIVSSSVTPLSDLLLTFTSKLLILNFLASATLMLKDCVSVRLPSETWTVMLCMPAWLFAGVQLIAPVDELIDMPLGDNVNE